MRFLLPLGAVLLAGPLLGSDSPRDYENSAVTDDSLAGEWTRVNLVLAGSDLGAPLWVLSFRDGKYTGHTGGLPNRGGTPLTAGAWTWCAPAAGRATVRAISCSV